MSFSRETYTFTHAVLLTGMVAGATAFMYTARHKNDDLVWFMEHWGLYMGIVATVGTFLLGLSLIGRPIYDDETHQEREAEHNRAVFEWNRKSPEERAIITAARRNELLHLTQILQNNTIIQSQEQAKPKRRY
jgi:predicted GNAT superfamily acetyltransferase